MKVRRRWRGLWPPGVRAHGAGGLPGLALAASERPSRIVDAVVDVASTVGLVGRKRVLDYTPIYDAVAPQDAVSLMRSAIRQLLRAADQVLRAVLTSRDAYTDKPVLDWTDRGEREALIESRARDGYALCPCWTAVTWPSRWPRRPHCWPRCSVRTWTTTWTGCSGSPAG